jgi:transposase-like protein
MAEIARLAGGSDCFEFVEREATPRWAMKLGIRLHLAGLSFSNTISELERFSIEQSRSTVHNWVQKARLQPTDSKRPDHVAVDETVIQIDDKHYWLYAAVDTDTNEFLYVKFGTAQNLGLSEIFFREFHEKHDVFLVDSAQWPQEALRRHGLRFQHETYGNRNTIERLYKEMKRRTYQFATHLRHVDPTTAETWLLAQAFCQNQLI